MPAAKEAEMVRVRVVVLLVIGSDSFFAWGEQPVAPPGRFVQRGSKNYMVLLWSGVLPPQRRVFRSLIEVDTSDSDLSSSVALSGLI